jgi:four helix bundle protein
MMSYEKLDVYKCAIQNLVNLNDIVNNLPKGQARLADQLKRAATSIPLNIAEGSGKRTKVDCDRYFYNARGSAMECAAVLDVCVAINLITKENQIKNKELLHRIVAMLTKMSR